MPDWTRHHIASRIQGIVDRLGRVDQQQMDQLASMLGSCSPDEVFEGLYLIFLDESRGNKRFVDQEVAGKLLWALKPPCTREPAEAIGPTLRNYDLSVEELPLYFASQYGKETVLETLDELEATASSGQERRSIETFRYWLRAEK